MRKSLDVSQNPLGLVEFLRDFGVEESGSLFAYVPYPRGAAGHEAWAWLETARMFDVVAGGPWRLDVDRRPKWLRETHPRLFTEKPVFFEVYRLDRERLADLVKRLGN